MGALTMTIGVHLHIGFEDNIYIRYGELAKSSADLVKRILTVAEALNIEVAKPDEARKILGLLKNHS
jgi:3-keto-5-aminohexanoate cleavage enzyme